MAGAKGWYEGATWKPSLLQLRPQQVADLAAFVLDSNDGLQDDGVPVVLPRAVHHLGAGRLHCIADLLAAQLRVVADVRLPHQVVDGELVVVQGAHVGHHGEGHAAVDATGHELPVHQELQGAAHLRDGEWVQLTFGRRVQG